MPLWAKNERLKTEGRVVTQNTHHNPERVRHVVGASNWIILALPFCLVYLKSFIKIL